MPAQGNTLCITHSRAPVPTLPRGKVLFDAPASDRFCWSDGGPRGTRANHPDGRPRCITHSRTISFPRSRVGMPSSTLPSNRFGRRRTAWNTALTAESRCITHSRATSYPRSRVGMPSSTLCVARIRSITSRLPHRPATPSGRNSRRWNTSSESRHFFGQVLGGGNEVDMVFEDKVFEENRRL